MIGATPLQIKRFSKWLKAQGAEIIPPTNQWEVLRFRCNGKKAVAYTNLKMDGRVSSASDNMRKAWIWYKGGEGLKFRTRPKKRVSKSQQTINALIERDGDECWYCGLPFPDDENDRQMACTIEHFVAIAHGGPNHLSNLALAHHHCNMAASHLSVSEKAKRREMLRARQKAKVA